MSCVPLCLLLVWSALVTDELCSLVCAGRLVSTGTFRALDIQLNPSDLNHFFVATDVVRCAASIFCISASSLCSCFGRFCLVSLYTPFCQSFAVSGLMQCFSKFASCAFAVSCFLCAALGASVCACVSVGACVCVRVCGCVCVYVCVCSHISCFPSSYHTLLLSKEVVSLCEQGQTVVVDQYNCVVLKLISR